MKKVIVIAVITLAMVTTASADCTEEYNNATISLQLAYNDATNMKWNAETNYIFPDSKKIDEMIKDTDEKLNKFLHCLKAFGDYSGVSDDDISQFTVQTKETQQALMKLHSIHTNMKLNKKYWRKK